MFNAIKSAKKKPVSNESSGSANIDTSRKTAAGEGGVHGNVNAKQQSKDDPSGVDAAAVGIDHPQEFDILLGRRKMSFNHVGNRRFRVYIGLHLRQYMNAPSRIQKTVVVNTVRESIHRSGGRFLKQDATTEKWVPVSDKVAREKVGHALRDAAGQRANMTSSTSGSDNSNSPPENRRSDVFGHSAPAPVGFMGLPQMPAQHSMPLPRPTEFERQQHQNAMAAATEQQMGVIQRQAAILQQQQQQTAFMLQQQMAMAAAAAGAQPQPPPPPVPFTHVHSNHVSDGALNVGHPVNPPFMTKLLAATSKSDTQDSSGSIGDTTNNPVSGEMSVMSAMSGFVGGDSVSAGDYSINTNLFDDESEGTSAPPKNSSTPSGKKLVLSFAAEQQPGRTKSSDAGTTANGSGIVSINNTVLSGDLSGMSLSTHDASPKLTALSDMPLVNMEINLHDGLPVEERHPLHDEHDDQHSTMQASIGSDICDSQGNVNIPKGASSVKSGGSIHKEWNRTLKALSGQG